MDTGKPRAGASFYTSPFSQVSPSTHSTCPSNASFTTSYIIQMHLGKITLRMCTDA